MFHVFMFGLFEYKVGVRCLLFHQKKGHEMEVWDEKWQAE